MIEFAGKFLPRVFGVFTRDPEFWAEHQYEVRIKNTSICNIGCIYDGKGQLQLGKEPHPLQTGDLFHFSKNHQMTMISSRENPLHYICVHYDYKQITWEGSELHIAEEPTSDLPIARVIRGELSGASAKMVELLRIWTERNAGFEWKANVFFQLLIFELVELQHVELEVQDPQYQAVLGSMNYIKQHYREPIVREKLAKMIAVTPSYYSILFKKYTGYTLTQYIHKLRIDDARHMLRSSHEPISKIALEVGFSDPLYFTRLFTRETGLSPSAYRQA